jgi:predicted HTH transcriptional regulator
LTWAAFFLELLRQQKDDLKAKIDRERNTHRLPGLILKIERLAKDRCSVTVAFLTGELKANRNTIKKHLQRLVEFGRLVKQGKGRGTYYVPY